MSGTEERRKSARQGRVKPTAHSSALESLRAAREGRESRAEQHDVRNLALFRLYSSLVKGTALCFGVVLFAGIRFGLKRRQFLIEDTCGSPMPLTVRQAWYSSAAQCCSCDSTTRIVSARTLLQGSPHGR